ncbi:MAG TPA: DUF2934 domain-containing protein [Opitutaceae bacterium]|nr:DUF2934 domain-containing protein [Opitutaceae bacterium]
MNLLLTTSPPKTTRLSSPATCPPSHQAIAECAYELWLQHGCPDHLDQAIWLDAEALLRTGRCQPSADYRELYRHGSRQAPERSTHSVCP